MRTKFYAKKECGDEILEIFPIEVEVIILPNKHYQAKVDDELYEIVIEQNVIGGEKFNAKFVYSSKKEKYFHSSVTLFGNISVKELNS